MTAGPLAPALESLAAVWREKASEFRRYGAEPQALALEAVAADLDAALAARADEALTLAQAASESNYSTDHLRHLVAAGQVPNAGRRGAPRVKRGDLPKRPGRTTSTSYNPDADALRLVRGAP